MKPRWFAALVPTAVFGALCAGCTGNNETVFIRQVPLPNPLNFCQVLPDPTLPFLLSGLADTAIIPDAYQQIFLVGNQTVPRGDATRLHPETSRVEFNDAVVQVFDGGTPLEDPFDVPVAGFADQAEDTNPGYGLAAVNPLITQQDLQTIATNHNQFQQGGVFVVARVQLKGATLGGDNVETGPFDWPVLVCKTTSTQICIPVVEPAACSDTLIGACFTGQDQPHDCRQLAEKKPLGGGVLGYPCADSTGCACVKADGTVNKCM